LPEGISAIWYRINGGERQLYNGTFTVDQPGAYTIEAYAIDDAQHQSETVSSVFDIHESGGCSSEPNACGQNSLGLYVCQNDQMVCDAVPPPEPVDTDQDDVPDCIDNCPLVANPDQINTSGKT
jgi:hypothetical protein